jgi:hypothetical protein
VGFKIDTSELDRYSERMRRDAPRKAKRATAKALNKTVVQAEMLAKLNVRKKFTLRNRWTEGSIRSVETPLTRAIKNQFVTVGSIQEYLAKQELGGSLFRTKQGRRITTARGSREGNVATPRKRLPIGSFEPKNIRLHRQKKVRGPKKRRAFLTVVNARRKGHRFIFLKLRADRAGIFEVQKNEIVMVHRILKRRVSVKPTPWLRPAADKARRVAPTVFRKELEKTLKL